MKSEQPFILRLTRNKQHPLIIGLLTSFIFVLIQFLVFEIEGIVHKLEYYQSTTFFTLTTGYLVFISRVIANNHRKGFDKLLSFSKLSEEKKEEFTHEFADQKISWLEMLIPIAVGSLHAYIQGFDEFFKGEVRFPILAIYSALQILIIWIMIWQSVSTYLRNMSKMNRASREIEIDLINSDQLMPLTSAGVTSILAFTGAYALMFTQDISFEQIYNPALIPLIPSIIWMIITPLKGVRKRIIREKEKEIELIDLGIEGDKEALKRTRIGHNLENINVVDLMTYKRLISNTPEVPINIPTASRFIFYLIIPFLTWVAASIVDKFIDYLIG